VVINEPPENCWVVGHDTINFMPELLMDFPKVLTVVHTPYYNSVSSTSQMSEQTFRTQMNEPDSVDGAPDLAATNVASLEHASHR
jgi:hypothetical protein